MDRTTLARAVINDLAVSLQEVSPEARRRTENYCLSLVEDTYTVEQLCAISGKVESFLHGFAACEAARVAQEG